MIFRKLFIVTLGVISAGMTSLVLAQTAPPGVEAYGRMPFFKNVQISPSGKRFFVFARPDDAGEYAFMVFENTPEGLKNIYSTLQTEDLRLNRSFWKRDDQIIISIKAPSKRWGTETVETRLFSIDPEEGEFVPLFRNPRSETVLPVQIQDRITNRLKDDPERILVTYYKDGLSGLYSVYTNNARNHKTVKGGTRGIDYWYTDGTGRLRGGWGILHEKKEKLLVFTADDKAKDISHRVAEGAPSFRFLGFPHNPEKAFVASSHETETDALYVYDIPTDSFDEQLFVSDVSDVYGVVQESSNGAALGVTFAEDEGEVHWFGDNLSKDVILAIDKAYPGHDTTLVSFNQGESHAVFFLEKGNIPGHYGMFDIQSGTIVELPSQYPDLDAIPMGESFSVSYEARDGLEIPAFVTLPPGMSSLEQAQNLPFVILPHGGPNARDFAGFDWEVQFLVSRGYGVLQMNFRGSSGYGQAFKEAGDREWGQAMQDDITDGASWIIEQGYADADRLAILGHSYGGYAALMGVVKTPDLYQCAVAHAPVTDLPRLIRHENQYVGGKYWTRRIGRLWNDREMLRENSPALRADSIKVPVLLFHGENDRVVNIDQSKRMVSGLKRQDKNYKYIELGEGTHYLDVGDNRVTFLREVESFLMGCLNS